MDKRSLIFVLVLTLGLFFVNMWFGNSASKNPEQVAEAAAIAREEAKVKKEQNIAQRIATLQSLPIVKMFDDKKALFSYAVEVNGSYLTLSKDDDLPKKVTVDGHSLNLVLDTGEKRGPIIYSMSKKANLTTFELPYLGTSDVQLVTLSKDNQEIEVILGEFDSGRIYFPGKVADTDAIVLYKISGQYVPVGFYRPKNKKFIPVSQIQALNEIATYVKPVSTPSDKEEKFYVLENDYQQLVFSNIGGSLAEINLPFYTKDDTASVVRPIGLDKKIEKNSPANARFPMNPYTISDNGVSVTKNPVTGGYYPLLRRGTKKTPSPIRLNAISTLSDDNSPVPFKMTKLTKNEIRFESDESHRRIIKTFRLPEDAKNVPYCIEIEIKVEGDNRGIWVTTGVPDVEIISGSFQPVLKYRTLSGSKGKVEKISLPKTSSLISSFYPDWICNSNGFFGLILDPLTEVSPGIKSAMIPGVIDPTRLSVIDAANKLYPVDKYNGYELMLPLKASSTPTKFRFFAGPFDTEILKQVDNAYSDPRTGYNPSYISSQSFHGWISFISEPFSKFIFFLMKIFYSITHSWGIAIILITIVLKLMLYPLNAWSIKSTQGMSQIAPKVEKLKKKYEKDPKRLQLETMALYKEHGVNPFTGCLPFILQLPFLMGMFDLLKSTFEIRGVGFIPGWITNLTAPDVLFSWNTPILFFGTEFHLLPFITGAVMYVQQKMMAGSAAKKNPNQQQSQQQKMGSVMTIVITFMFYNLPSGLNIYFLSSMLLGILQQWYMAKKKKSPNVVVCK